MIIGRHYQEISMKKLRCFCLTILVIGLSIPLFAQNLTVRLTVIANALGNATSQFESVSPPVYRDNYYAFVGMGSPLADVGIFANPKGFRQVIASNRTHIPNGHGRFASFGNFQKDRPKNLSLSLNDQGVIAF